ncbi:transcription elongation factor TFIIS-like [Hibiscus syriacus]|uniref:transcription elongation factor TFIIS-like n=1 Tax=Hibiscus syriacus TaxID=106335 RepID=UPI001924167C|nr:transcription elongation factor TFIIS-like [Hibiscus syriacus]
MERELVDLFEAAKKAADLAASSDVVFPNGADVSRCVDALKQLKAFPVSYDILVSTKVGKRLRPLTKHPREKIQTVASDLLEFWKKIVIEETAKSKKNGTTGAVKLEKLPKPSAMKSEKPSNTESVKAEKVLKDGSVKPVKVEKRESNGEIDKVEKIYKDVRQAPDVKKPLQPSAGPPKLTSMAKCNDPLRDKFREILVEAFSKVPSEVDKEKFGQVNACDPIEVAVAVESVMFEKMGKSNGTQKFKYRSIMFNLKDPKNPDLRRKVLLGEVIPERLISMTPEEMASDERQRENNEIKQKALFDCERGLAPKATTDQFKCGRCGQRKTTYYQMQTRSADEPMTTYVTCVNCNNHWKFC